MKPENILQFWFKEISSQQWWKKDPEFDQLIKTRFGEILHRASRCELYSWRDSPEGSLAEIIILDQFSRNIYRDQPQAFSQDPLALCLAQQAVAAGFDQKLNSDQKAFLYMPYMHSESRIIHEEAVRLYRDGGLESNLDFELRHKAIIDRFGRYPHRNETLKRTSTQEEIEFLKEPGSSF